MTIILLIKTESPPSFQFQIVIYFNSWLIEELLIWFLNCFITKACCISASVYFAPALGVDPVSGPGEADFQLPIFEGLPLPLRRFGVLGCGLFPAHWYMRSSWNEFGSESSNETIVPAFTRSRPICLPMYLEDKSILCFKNISVITNS